jgi:hypothetical protein
LGTNLPVDELGAGLGLAAVVAAAALRDDTPYKVAPTTPPMTIDPAMAAAVNAVRNLFIANFLLSFLGCSSVATEIAVRRSVRLVRKL